MNLFIKLYIKKFISRRKNFTYFLLILNYFYIIKEFINLIISSLVDITEGLKNLSKVFKENFVFLIYYFIFVKILIMEQILNNPKQFEQFLKKYDISLERSLQIQEVLSQIPEIDKNITISEVISLLIKELDCYSDREQRFVQDLVYLTFNYTLNNQYN